MAITNFTRYEEKYLLTKEQYCEIQKVLLQHMEYDQYCPNGQVYTIHNIYYDDDNDTVIINSLSKPFYKEKLRLRSYRSLPAPDDKIFLEVKKKINGVVSKRRIVLNYSMAQDFLEHKEIDLKGIDIQKYNELKYYLAHHKVTPKVYLRYDRVAYFGRDDKEFRVTFDNNIMANRKNPTFSCVQDCTTILGENMYLMEIKINKSLPIWLVDFLTKNKIYPASFSKYGKEFIQYRRKINE